MKGQAADNDTAAWGAWRDAGVAAYCSGVLKAVIFDMDGVLVDTEPAWREVEIETFTSLGLHFTEADSITTMGMRLPEAVAHWHGLQPWSGPDIDEVADLIIDAMVRHVRAHGEAMPGALSVLSRVRAAGLRTAIASSSPLRLITATVSRLGIGGDLDVICSAEHDRLGKPHPAVYLRTAAELGLHPRECLAIEDSPNGVMSAVDSGMLCCAVPDPAVRQHPAFGRAHLCLPALTDFSDDSLAELSSRAAEAAPDERRGPSGSAT